MSVSFLAPQNSLEVASIVRDAAARRQAIEIIGGGSKRALGRPTDAAITVDVSGLSGVTLYELAELVVSARAGTPLQHVTDLLAQQGQMLPFEPADYRPLLASTGSLPSAAWWLPISPARAVCMSVPVVMRSSVANSSMAAARRSSRAGG